MAVVSGALEPAVELTRRSAQGGRDEVVDIAVHGGDVAPGRMLAMPVADLDGAAQCPGEGPAMGHRDHGGRAVEQDRLDLGGAQPRGETLRGDDRTVGELAEVAERI